MRFPLLPLLLIGTYLKTVQPLYPGTVLKSKLVEELFEITPLPIKIVKQSNENIGGASHNALTVTLYGINPSDAEDAFRSYMKKVA